MVATQDQMTTGTRDITYDLISVIYHALQGIETYDMYVRDAHSANDMELAEFFSRAQDENRQVADRGKTLLAARINKGGSR